MREDPSRDRFTRARLIAFTVVLLACVAAALIYALRARNRASAPDSSVAVISTDPDRLVVVLRAPHVFFRNTALGAGYGRLALASLSEPDGTRYVAGLECERVDFGGGVGVCLTANRRFTTTYTARILDGALATTHEVPLSGIPSRARVSPDGRLAAVTVFVAGHSYASSVFSTKTILIDTQRGSTIADLEQFTVTRAGSTFKSVDFNFWGVTFTRDPNRFFATLSSRGVFYLIEGDANARRAQAIKEGVECPSLSPDERRIAFKKRTTSGGRLIWQLAVLDLATRAERILSSETRSIDDQVEWLDNERILYATQDDQFGPGATSIWSLNVDDGSVLRWLPNAYSPSVPPAVSIRR